MMTLRNRNKSLRTAILVVATLIVGASNASAKPASKDAAKKSCDEKCAEAEAAAASAVLRASISECATYDAAKTAIAECDADSTKTQVECDNLPRPEITDLVTCIGELAKLDLAAMGKKAQADKSETARAISRKPGRKYVDDAAAKAKADAIKTANAYTDGKVGSLEEADRVFEKRIDEEILGEKGAIAGATKHSDLRDDAQDAAAAKAAKLQAELDTAQNTASKKLGERTVKVEDKVTVLEHRRNGVSLRTGGQGFLTTDGNVIRSYGGALLGVELSLPLADSNLFVVGVDAFLVANDSNGGVLLTLGFGSRSGRLTAVGIGQYGRYGFDATPAFAPTHNIAVGGSLRVSLGEDPNQSGVGVYVDLLPFSASFMAGKTIWTPGASVGIFCTF